MARLHDCSTTWHVLLAETVSGRGPNQIPKPLQTAHLSRSCVAGDSLLGFRGPHCFRICTSKGMDRMNGVEICLAMLHM